MRSVCNIIIIKNIYGFEHLPCFSYTGKRQTRQSALSICPACPENGQTRQIVLSACIL